MRVAFCRLMAFVYLLRIVGFYIFRCGVISSSLRFDEAHSTGFGF